VDVESLVEEGIRHSDEQLDDQQAPITTGTAATVKVLTATLRDPKQKEVHRARLLTESRLTTTAPAAEDPHDNSTAMKVWRLQRTQAARSGGSAALEDSTARVVALSKFEALRAQAHTGTVESALARGLTRRLRISPTFGRAEYVALDVENFDEEVTWRAVDKAVTLVTDLAEQDANRQPAGLRDATDAARSSGTMTFKYKSNRVGAQLGGPAQKVEVDRNEDRVGGDVGGPLPTCVGGKLVTGLTHAAAEEKATDAAREIEIEVNAGSVIVAKLQLSVQPRPFVIDFRHHFYSAENQWTTHRLVAAPHMIPRWRQAQRPQQPVAWSAVVHGRTDIDVSVLTVDGEVQVVLHGRCATAPNVCTYFLVLYSDRFQASPSGIWQIVEHALESRVVMATAGQSTQITLSASGNDGLSSAPPIRSVVFHASSHILACRSAAVGVGGSVEAQATICPLSVGERAVVVTACDAESALGDQIVHGWLLRILTTAPAVSRRYEALGLPSDRQKRVKIKIANPEPQRYLTLFYCYVLSMLARLMFVTIF
jgi:hypothetical protein